MSNNLISIGMADDYPMIRESIKTLIESQKGFKVTIEADNGKDLIQKLKVAQDIPSIILVDIVMPIMNGFDTIKYLGKNYSEIKCIALSINNDFLSVFKMIDCGARAYLSKDCSTFELIDTIDKVYKDGIYYNSFVINSLIDYQRNTESQVNENAEKGILDERLSSREVEFIKMACSDLTYKEIADKMSISVRTVDGYRESVFYKLNIKSRVGLVIFAIRNNLYSP